MDRETLRALAKYLSPRKRKYQGGRPQVVTEKSVAMTCAFLGSQMPYKQLAGIFGVSEECFIRTTDKIMELIVQKSKYLIRWPDKSEYAKVAAEFNKSKRRYIFKNIYF